MTERQINLLRKARRKLAASRALLAQGFAEDAVSRAYDTMFYLAEALRAAVRRGAKLSGRVSPEGATPDRGRYRFRSHRRCRWGCATPDDRESRRSAAPLPIRAG